MKRENGFIIFSDTVKYDLVNKCFIGDVSELDFPLHSTEPLSFLFRGTYLGRYCQLYNVKMLHPNDLKLLNSNLHGILEQAFKLNLPFLVRIIAEEPESIENLSATSISKLTEFTPAQLRIIQKYIVAFKILSLNTFLYRLHLLKDNYKGVSDEIFEKVCNFITFSFNTFDEDFIKFVLNPKLSISKNIEKLEQLTPTHVDYFRIRQFLLDKFPDSIDVKKFPVLPKKDNVQDLYNEIRILENNLLNEKVYKELNDAYSKIIPLIQSYEFSDEQYSIIIPSKIQDLEREGSVLHHCVGSYKDVVSQGREYIFFLRKTDNISQPYYTIDVDTEGFVRQIHTNCNKNISDDKDSKLIMNFLYKWADSTNFINKKSLKYCDKVKCHL